MYGYMYGYIMESSLHSTIVLISIWRSSDVSAITTVLSAYLKLFTGMALILIPISSFKSALFIMSS